MIDIKVYTYACPDCGEVIELPQPDFACAVVDHKIAHDEDGER